MTQIDMQLWEILVPTVHRISGKPIKTRYHRVWDTKVREIAGGLTILRPAKGIWVHERSGEIFEERMIPVRIAAPRSKITEIISLTATYYDQYTVMAYKVSETVILYDNPELAAEAAAAGTQTDD